MALLLLCLNGPYYLLARTGIGLRRQAYARMLIDVLLVTGGLYGAGGLAAAGYVSIYAVVTVYAGIAFSGTACLVAVAVATLSFVGMALLPHSSWLSPALPSASHAWRVAAFNLFVLVLVGALTAVLSEAYRRIQEAERRARVDLEARARELQLSRDRLRALSLSQFAIREEEAKRIARMLHDEAGQLLTAVNLSLDALAVEATNISRQRLAQARGLLDQLEAQLRSLSHELRPLLLDTLGLLAALERLAQSTTERTGLSVTVVGTTNESLPLLAETALYRVVQEALTNVLRHAQATQVAIDIRREGPGVRCAIRDDGVGFDPQAVLTGLEWRGLGLITMRERVEAQSGTFQITSVPGRGTELVITIPVVESSRGALSCPDA